MDDLKKLASATKSYITNILHVLNLIKGKEKYIVKAPQSVKTNYFFSFLGIILTIVIILALVFIKAITRDGSITGLGIFVVALVCFGINIWKLYRCEEYHNRRPSPMVS